jgi:hypothetical protein
MPARLRFLPALLVATAGLFALTTVITAQPAATPPTPESLKRTEEENLKLYKRFADELLKLAQKWEKSDNPDEKERAKSLRAALKTAEEKGIENLFKQLINPLSKPTPGAELPLLLQKDRALIAALKEVLETLNTEDEAEKNKQLRMETEAFLKEAKRILREQETLRARTEGKGDPNKIAKDQNQLAKETKDLANQLAKGDPKDGRDGDPKGGNAQPKDEKSEQKPDSSKPGDPSAEQKPDTQDPKSTGKDPMDGKGDPMSGDPKPGDPKGGEPMAGSSKESPKEGPMGDPMGAKPMGDPKPMDPSDPKSPMDAKPSPPSDSKSQGMGKGDSKPSDGKGGDAKPMPPSDGSPMNSPPMGGSKGDPSGGSPPPPSKRPPNPNNPNDEAQRDLDDAVPDQNEAEKKLNEKKNDEAGKNQDDALGKIAKAIKELEKRLKQLREKEMRQKLEDLERRVAKMLQMQTEVYEATKRIDGAIKKNNNEIATVDRQKATVEAEKEGNIAIEAEKALRLLEGEGTAIVFAGVLEEAKKDMDAVKKELDRTNVSSDTQLIEEQIIAQLKRMLEALKKAKQDLDNPPPPPPPGMPPPPSDPKKNLIQLVEQLKLLKELQIQVNDRTTAFGKRTPGNQATDSLIQEQLKLLSERQETLKRMLQKVADQMSQ